MAIPELDPRKHSTSDADVPLGRSGTAVHHGDTRVQLAQAGPINSLSVQSTIAEAPSELVPRAVLGPYTSTQKSSHSLRVLIVATEAPPVHGGIAREVGYLRDGLQERGHHVDVLAYPEIGRLVLGEIRLSGLIAKLPRLFRCINAYDVIHVHGTTPTISDAVLLLARLKARLPGPHPLVIYTHHMDLDFRPGGILNRAYNYLHHRLSARADAVIASTQDNLRRLGDRGRGLVIPCGIDVEHFYTKGQKDAQFTVLFVGQFRPYKGVHVLLQAMSQVRGAQLLVAGQGQEEQAYRALAAELGLDVEFHIGVDDNQLCQLYDRAHTVVLPSVSQAEAFGIVLVEGMAAGCIPIASYLPGVRDVVGRSGFLFPAGEASQLARILCSLRDDRVLVRQMGERARLRAADFRQERIVSDYEHLIAALIESRDLRKRLADLAAHLDVTSIVASQELKNQLANQVESCASALRAYATNAIRATWSAGFDPESGVPDTA